MISLNRVCWDITSKCNEQCKFCFRNVESLDLSLSENISILNKLVSYGIKKITFTGGEALLYEGIWTLLAKAKKAGIFVQLNTNAKDVDVGILDNIEKYVDCLTLPLDSIDSYIQHEMGRNESHVENVATLLKDIIARKNKLRIKINTVVTRLNFHDVLNIIPLLNKYRVDSWKVFQFAPLRYEAKRNISQLYVSDDSFYELVERIKSSYDSKVIFQNKDGFINSYMLITANGNIIYGDGTKDIVKGNVLRDSLSQILKCYDFDYIEYQKRGIAV